MKVLLAGNCSTEKSSQLIHETRANLEAKGHDVFVADSFEGAMAILQMQEIERGIIDPWLPTTDQQTAKAVNDLYRRVFIAWLSDEVACSLAGLLAEGELQQRRIPGIFFDTRVIKKERGSWVLPSGEKIDEPSYGPLAGYMLSRRRKRWFEYWIDGCPCCALVGL